MEQPPELAPPGAEMELPPGAALPVPEMDLPRKCSERIQIV